MFKDVWEWLFNRKETRVPYRFETKEEAKYRRKMINEGNARTPDWRFLADNIRLDQDKRKHETLYWYWIKFKDVEPAIRNVAYSVNAPWWFIAGIDMREMSFDHSGHFANGEKIIGTGRKTTKLYPYGLGPADTWAQSVEQALTWERSRNKDFDRLVQTQMSFADALEAWEDYNGHGFRKRGEYSEYVVGFTNFHDETGRYVADGRYSPTAKVVRPGAAAFALYLIQKGDLFESDLFH